MEKRFIQELCHWIILSWWLMLPNKSCSPSVSCKVLAALIVNCKLKCAAIRAKWSILLPQMKTISSSVFRLSGCHQDSWSFIKPFQVLFSIITILCGNNNTNRTRCRYICNNPKAPSPRMDMRVIQRRWKKRGKWGNDQFDHVTILKFWFKNSTIPIKCKSWTASTYSLKKYGSITAQTGAGQPRPSLWCTQGRFLDTSRHQQPTFRPLGGGLLLAFLRVSRVSGGK